MFLNLAMSVFRCLSQCQVFDENHNEPCPCRNTTVLKTHIQVLPLKKIIVQISAPSQLNHLIAKLRIFA
jgi:hypothetical protein